MAVTGSAGGTLGRRRARHQLPVGDRLRYVQMTCVTRNIGDMRNRVADYRNRMRQRGYKEVRFWVPDTTSGEFAARIRDEAPALNETDTREHTAAFLDDIQADVLTSSEG